MSIFATKTSHPFNKMGQRDSSSICSYLPKRRSPIYLLFILSAIVILLCSRFTRNSISAQQVPNKLRNFPKFTSQEINFDIYDEMQQKRPMTQRESKKSKTQETETKSKKLETKKLSAENQVIEQPKTLSKGTKPAPAKQYYDAHKYDFMTGGYLNFYNMMLEQRLLFSFYLNDLNKDPLSPQQKLRQVCTFLTENSPKRIEVAKGYDCLLQLQMQEVSNPTLDFFRAIKYGSLSLETVYTPTAAANLMKAILSGYENEVPFFYNSDHMSKCCTGYRKDEEQFLDEVLKINNTALKERVLIRQSFIHVFGRSSFNENTTKVNLQSAIDSQSQVRNTAQVTQSNVFDIVLTANENDVVGAAICIISALVNSDFDSFYKFHVVMDPANPISQASQQKLSSFTHIRNYSVDFTGFPVNLVSDIKQKLGTKGEKLIKMYRLFLDAIFPNLETVLFLDTHTIVLRDLNVLKTIDMTDYIWAGAPSLTYRYNFPQCNGILPHYFINAGVLLVNLTNSRRLSIHDKITDHIKFDGECGEQEQDLINALFPDYIYFLPHRWNAIVIPYSQRFHFSSFIGHHIGDTPWSDKNEHLFENTFQQLPSLKPVRDRYRELTGL